jgi:hypothetical protein
MLAAAHTAMSMPWPMASTAPIRAEVPSMISMIAPSFPSGFGPESDGRRH